MGKNITRISKLENKIKFELSKPEPEIENILLAVGDYESDNIATIEKLKKKRQATAKKVNGAIRQSINAHGPVTMLLIGSCTKRIMGSIMTNDAEDEVKNKISIKGFLYGIGFTSLIYLISLIF